jgi:hypothetical protein
MNNSTEMTQDMSTMPSPILANSVLNDINDIDEPSQSGEEPTSIRPITDEEAEFLLPGYQIAFEEYHIFRAEGASPEEALKKTLAEWRTLWAAAAYVPHRHSL